MAGIKISALPVAGSAQLTDILPVVQAGVTKQETLGQLSTLFSSSLATSFLPLIGGTMTGSLILNADPTLPLQAATKEYVDTVASGFTVILACDAATTVNLNTVYANGAAGVGATLTDNSGTFAAFSVDGVSPPLTSRILVKNQSSTFQNGVYELTTNGDGMAIPYVLTRTTDYDQAPAEIHPGTLIAVNTGTVNATSSWLETATVTNIGVDPILFSQFSFGPSSFLLKANNLSDVNNVAASRTNLGLGTAALKAASDGAQPNLASVVGAGVINNLASFADVAGSVKNSAVGITGGFPVTLNFTGPTNVTFPTSGTLLTTTSSGGRFLGLQVFKVNGTYTANVLANNALFMVKGGGGGGAGSSPNLASPGGGEGGMAISYQPVVGGFGYTVVIGTAGAAGLVGGGVGGNGGNSTVSGGTLSTITGNGGTGGSSNGTAGLGGNGTAPSGYVMPGASGESLHSNASQVLVGGSGGGNGGGRGQLGTGSAGIANSGGGGGGSYNNTPGALGGTGIVIVYEYS